MTATACALYNFSINHLKADMTQAAELWTRIIERLEDKLQYGALEQVKAVKEVKLEGSELQLVVDTEEAQAYFSADVNQQRLIILARPEVTLESVSVEFKPTS